MANWHTMHTEGHQKQIAGYALGNEVKHHNSFIVTHAHTKIILKIKKLFASIYSGKYS